MTNSRGDRRSAQKAAGRKFLEQYGRYLNELRVTPPEDGRQQDLRARYTKLKLDAEGLNDTFELNGRTEHDDEQAKRGVPKLTRANYRVLSQAWLEALAIAVDGEAPDQLAVLLRPTNR